ncbi:hypothetical protein PG994_001773 [Apiospora phragmitis]|uniref:Uncharacterized protein n=1 Tax=Apiospora phragmitis TaxID=2905665 RepID=A0ABR1WUD3_9PEZI
MSEEEGRQRVAVARIEHIPFTRAGEVDAGADPLLFRLEACEEAAALVERQAKNNNNAVIDFIMDL